MPELVGRACWPRTPHGGMGWPLVRTLIQAHRTRPAPRGRKPPYPLPVTARGSWAPAQGPRVRQTPSSRRSTGVKRTRSGHFHRSHGHQFRASAEDGSCSVRSGNVAKLLQQLRVQGFSIFLKMSCSSLRNVAEDGPGLLRPGASSLTNHGLEFDTLLFAQTCSVKMGLLRARIAGGSSQRSLPGLRKALLSLRGHNGQVKGNRAAFQAGQEHIGAPTVRHTRVPAFQAIAGLAFRVLGEVRLVRPTRTMRPATHPPATQVPAWSECLSRTPWHCGHQSSPEASGTNRRCLSSATKLADSIRVRPAHGAAKKALAPGSASE